MKKKSLLIISIFGLIVLAGCAKAAATAVPEVYSKAGSDNTLRVQATPMSLEAPAPTTAPANGVTGSDVTVDNSNQMVIKDASLNILVDDPMKTLSDIMKMASDMDGYTVSSNSYQAYTSSGEQVPEASVTIRVPAKHLDEALDKIKAMTGDPAKYVTNATVSGQDVTQTYTDLQSRLRNLQEAEAQLNTMYEKAQKADDVLAIYNQIMQVNEQIEVLKGQIQYYQEATATSSITVQISAKASVQPVTVAGWEPKGVARNAVQALINFGKGFVNFLIWLVIYVLPVLLIIALVFGVPIFFFIRWLVRRNRRELEKRNTMPPLPVEKK